MEKIGSKAQHAQEVVFETQRQTKVVKMIEEEHFPILCSKLDGFKDELTLIDAFVAGLIASYDYSTISMIFRKILEKKCFANKLELSNQQKIAVYWDLFKEMTKCYKIPNKNYSTVKQTVENDDLVCKCTLHCCNKDK